MRSVYCTEPSCRATTLPVKTTGSPCRSAPSCPRRRSPAGRAPPPSWPRDGPPGPASAVPALPAGIDGQPRRQPPGGPRLVLASARTSRRRAPLEDRPHPTPDRGGLVAMRTSRPEPVTTPLGWVIFTGASVHTRLSPLLQRSTSVSRRRPSLEVSTTSRRISMSLRAVEEIALLAADRPRALRLLNLDGDLAEARAPLAIEHQGLLGGQVPAHLVRFLPDVRVLDREVRGRRRVPFPQRVARRFAISTPATTAVKATTTTMIPSASRRCIYRSVQFRYQPITEGRPVARKCV